MHIAVIWQRFLPYHVARLRRLQERLSPPYRLTGIEVASQDGIYSFPEIEGHVRTSVQQLCCFPGQDYHRLTPARIHLEVVRNLLSAAPDVVFAPASAFPEGMAAISYRNRGHAISVMMDDAWSGSDQRGALTRFVKRQIHQNVDGAFVPSAFYASYYQSLGFPSERIFYGVDVVDNGFYERAADAARDEAAKLRPSLGLPANYFLFVGRGVPRKGLRSLMSAYARYRATAEHVPWGLVIVGTTDARPQFGNRLSHDGVIFAGQQFGVKLASYMGLAGALVVPSERDPWGLVVNEGMAAGLPVIVSSGCGAAHTLVSEGANGMIVPPGNVEGLSYAMRVIASTPCSTLSAMGQCSRDIISRWTLDTFADGVLQACHAARRPPAGSLANLLTRVWKGRVDLDLGQEKGGRDRAHPGRS